MRNDFIIEFKKGYVRFEEQWTPMFESKRFNWINFDLIGAKLEWDRRLGLIEPEISLLGFRIYVQINYTNERIQKNYEEMKLEMESYGLPVSKKKNKN